MARALLAASVPFALLTSETAHAAKPPLPTPCVGGACGTNAQSFVQYGAAGASVNGNQMTVTQTTGKAILNWADFNIANGYSVNFVQPSATSATLNKIWSADPSVIAGALKANGQVYLYNQNGIVFDKGAQVDVGGLVASSLRLATTSSSTDPDVLFKNGILSNNANAPSTTTLPPVFQAAPGADGTTPTAGNVTVNAGATLNTAEGGRIMLLGSSVSNQGTISAPGGQVILGAGKTVYLAASSDPAMRGLLIEVANGGTATNAGQISSARGNVTLAGLVVNQEGTIAATTSVSENGSIYLVAGDTSSANDTSFYNLSNTGFGALAPNEGGTVNVAPGSVTTITADTSSTATITQQSLDNQSFQPSQVSLVGKSVTLESGSTIVAPGGKVSAVAAGDPYLALKNPGVAENDGGRIYLATGSTIDVSGLQDVPVSATRNLVQVTLEGNDLQDDPLLRDGLLHGLTVTVDAVRGSTLFDVTPYAGNISLGINEVLTKAGSISLISNGDVITRAGSNLNVSGGSVAYQGGYGPSTTKLLGANGKVYDISTAPKDVEYTAVVSNYSYVDPTWGTKSQSTAQSFYPGYTQGADAGSVEVLGSQIYLRGTMTAATTAGIYQRSAASLPLGGLLQIGCQCTAGNSLDKDLWAPAVTFANSTSDTLASNFNFTDLTNLLPADLQKTTLIGLQGLTSGGFNRLSIFSNGAVTLPVGTNVQLAPGGSLSAISVDSIEVAGNISIMGGTVSLATQERSSSGVGATHDILLAAGADIDVRGGWVNDSSLLTSLPGTAPAVIDGGTVSMSATGNTVIGASSSIDVSGGGWISSSNALTAGKGGSINLSADYAINTTTAPQSGLVALGAGAVLSGNSLAAGSGGTLSISSGSLTVAGVSAGTPGELLLSPDFFAGRGFATYNLTGQNRVTIGSTTSSDAPVVIHPQQENLVFTGNSLLQPTGTDLNSFTQLQLLPASQRKAASITFSTTSTSTSSPGAPDIPDEGNIILSQNASIVTDPGASVSLLAHSQTGSIDVFGTINAPAGDITLQIQSSNAIAIPSSFGYEPGQEILLGDSAALSAAGYAQIDALNSKGYLQGKVLDAGSISLLAYRGYVVTKPGSQINVDGASGVINVPTAGGAAQLIAGNAGSIAIDAREGLVLQGSLSGRAASDSQGQPIAGASGGALTVGLDLYSYFGTNATNSGQPLTPYSLDARVLTLTDRPASALSTFEQSGVAQVSTQLLGSGGFDNVAVKSADIIAFDGPVNLSARASLTLDAPLLSAGSGAAVQLSAPHVTLGYYANSLNSATPADYFNPPAVTSTGTINPNTAAVLNPGCSVECTGTLNVSAQEVDILGVSGWSGFKQEQITSSGDIRLGSALSPWGTAPALHTPSGDTSNPLLRSGLNVTGDLTLTAQQVYPTTATDFTLTAASSVTIAPASGSASVPLSAGGTITIDAPKINQGGTLRAPMGQIYLQAQDVTDPVTGDVTPGTVTLASGSLTSVSADGATLPFGTTVNGQQWVYSSSSAITDVFDAPPSKSISLNGSDVSVSKGATVDLSGGGDLYAYEWIKGPGGSKDVLGTSGVYQYALVPSLGSNFAPIDPLYAQSSPTVGANRTVYLTGVPGIANGWYALLPARYALLPGAYAVEVVKSNSDIAAGSVLKQPDGSYLVAGRFGVAGTDVQDSRTSSLLIVSSAIVRTQSQYTDSTANEFYANAASTAGTVAPRLPADAGQLQLQATQQLALDGAVKFATGQFQSGTDSAGKPIMQTGLGGQASIQASNIVVTDSGAALPAGSASGALQLDVNALDALGAQTLILGANSTTTKTGEVLASPITQSVELANTSTALTGPQIVLAARDSVVVDDNAKIAATGSSSLAALPLSVQGSAAVLRVSAGSGGTLSVDSTVPQSASGQLSIGSHASVQASGSLLLYSSASTSVQQDANISAPGVALYSNHVSIGDVPAGDQSGGLVLTQPLLSGLSGLTDLTIGSSSTIDLYGTVNFGAAASGGSALHSITLDSWGLAGFGTGDKSFEAGTISLVNSNPASGAPANAAPGTGSGAISLVAFYQSNVANSGDITLGAGTKTLSGFGSVSLQADNLLESASGSGSLNVGSASLAMHAAAVTAAGGANQTIVSGGAVSIDKAAGSATLNSGDLGGSLSIQGASIAQNGVINLPAGNLTLHATSGDIELGAGSTTAAAGVVRTFSTTSAAVPGGQIVLTSDTGNVGLGAGAILDLSGAASADGKSVSDGGSLTVNAPLGQFAFDPSAALKGSASTGAIHAGATVNVGSGLAGGGLDALAALLQAGSFTGDLAIRSHMDGALSLASTVVAHSFNLTADQGSINVSGTINTSAQTANSLNGGNIALWSGTDLTLESGAQLLANAGVSGPVGLNGSKLASSGGSITLGAASGSVSINSGSAQNPTRIEMTGSGDASSDGTLTLRAPRTVAEDGVQINIPSATNLEIDTRKPVVIEGVQVYTANVLGGADSGCGTGGSCDVADMNGHLFTDAQQFIANAATISSSLHLPSNVTVQVTPGIEIRSAGDLTLDNTTNPSGVWNLDSWDAALNAPLAVTLRAQGNLVFNASLSDGFTDSGSGVLATWTFGNSVPAIGSSSYRLTGGADLSSADPLAVVAQALPSGSGSLPTTGNLIVTPGNMIRTGTGSIDIAAGGDVLLGYIYTAGTTPAVPVGATLTSVIYTAGQPAAALDPTLFLPSRATGIGGTPAYPTNGGDLSVTAADDIRSVPSAQLVSDWQWRRDTLNDDGTLRGLRNNPSWWVVFKNFDQGFGVLGGGSLALNAGGDIVNVSAVIPTTGRLPGLAGALPDITQLSLTGGGQLTVRAGGNIAGGVFDNDWGNTRISAGGGLVGGATLGDELAGVDQSQISTPLSSLIYPVLLTGSGDFSVSARTGADINFVGNSLMLPEFADNIQAAGQNAYFYGYTGNSAISIASSSGDVLLHDTIDNLPLGILQVGSSSNVPKLYQSNPYDVVYPGTVEVTALGGNIGVLNSALNLFPAATGNLELLAEGSITGSDSSSLNSQFTLNVFESDPANWPSLAKPAGSSQIPASAALPTQPLHEDDDQSIYVVASTGNIGSIAGSTMNFPKAANVVAGGDILNLQYTGKNLHPYDVTSIQAGGSITYSTPTDPTTNVLLPNSIGITVGGPGFVEVLAGGALNLGDSNGIVSSGNLNDVRLPSTGASLVVGAGFGKGADGQMRQPDYTDFISAYVSPDSQGNPGAYQAALIKYMNQLFPSDAAPTYSAALSAFNGLTREQQLPFLTQVLMNELSQTGLDHNNLGATYDRGYKAIATLFPTKDAAGQALTYKGDIDMFFSQLKTQQGGDINVLAPGGSVVVGVPNPPAALDSIKTLNLPTGIVSSAANLGMLVLGSGAIRGFADQNFDVNQSRIQTLEGGDIILWASNGNIDAGRGAKSASGAPPPVIQTDPSGNVFVNPLNDVSGSGIGQLVTGPDQTPGLVNLIAPRGAVDAGDAGIRVAGNLNIAAVVVIGANNITVAGTSTGVPVSDAGALSGALSGANSLGDAGKTAVDQLSQSLTSGANFQQLSDSLTPAFIVVRMFCLGVDCQAH